ncbi:HAMP domain-containing histidine kinase [Rhodococcus sp. D2-41]|uniref:sensor histidine kinase n=1 Tax=Speluncibacter jeojiensis TaxID=2710754 RepID=UPI0024104F26|nr:HAMP domain-containing sensor histidine kinase [Rhodococcus sp. D2-41]MDG3009441.1 HAMP domain-containing histidine kinase [Rhodococcus sp. D2-41]
MSSSLPADRPRRWSPRRWSLRARLVIGVVALLLIVCTAVGITTQLALRQYLIRQLDTSLTDAGHRSAMIAERPPPPPGRWVHPGPGPDFLDAPGQPPGTIAAIITDGNVDAGTLTKTGARAALTSTAKGQLAELPVDGRPHTLDVDGLGQYRVLAMRTWEGHEIITGLSLASVNATLLRVLVTFVVVAAAALVLATVAGLWVIRRALQPLYRVATTARAIADMPLHEGEVRLPVRVPDMDTNPRTEVGQMGGAINGMLEHIARALKSRQASETRVRQFVADASHELRTPLTSIRGYTELAQRAGGEVPDEVAHAMSRVASESNRMSTLVEDLLLLARLDSGRPLEAEPVDLCPLIVDTVSDAHVAGPDHHWNLELPEDPVYVLGDPARLQQVLVNLLANARNHTGPGTSVTTALRSEGGTSVLTVSDDGPGIPEALLPDIFERFARGDSSRSRRAGSTGLGLSIVDAVVKAHHGTIDVQSIPGRTAFTVRLPLCAQPAGVQELPTS